MLREDPRPPGPYTLPSPMLYPFVYHSHKCVSWGMPSVMLQETELGQADPPLENLHSDDLPSSVWRITKPWASRIGSLNMMVTLECIHPLPLKSLAELFTVLPLAVVMGWW